MVAPPDRLPPIRTRASGGRDRSPVDEGIEAEAAQSPDPPVTAAKRVAPRLARSSSAVFFLGDAPVGAFKPIRASSRALSPPPADTPREVLPGTAELLRARSLRAAPPAQTGGLRSALRTLNAIATPCVLWKHKRAQDDVAQAKENGLLR